MTQNEQVPVGGTIVVVEANGDLMVHADVGRATGYRDAIVDDGKHVAVYRADGARMAISTKDAKVQLNLTGEVDVAEMQAPFGGSGRADRWARADRR